MTRPPIYVTAYAHSPIPRRIDLGHWHWEVRDGATGPVLTGGTTHTRWGAMRHRERARGACKRRPVIKHRMAPTRTFTDADREYGLAVINACLVDYDAGMRRADNLTLQHEAERLESEPSSPVVKSMRLIVDGVRATRAGAVSARA